MGTSGTDAEGLLKNMNEKLNEKTVLLLREANKIMESDNFSIKSPNYLESGLAERLQGEITSPKTAACSELDSKADDTLEEAASKLEKTTRTRVFATKLRALDSENKGLRYELRTMQDKNEELTKLIQEVNVEKARFHKQVVQLSSSVEKLRTELVSFKQYSSSLSMEKASMERQLEKERQQHEKDKSDSRNLEVRFQRVLEEVRNLSSQLENSRSNINTIKKEFELVSNENRRLERQKNELISAFKKQMKLIDVLRRQKMLLEASQALKLTEEEFMKTLDWHIGDAKNHLSDLPTPSQPPGDLVQQGAEARIYSVAKRHLSTLPNVACIVKERFVKTYRHPCLDASLSLRRMRAEARQLVKCRQLGLPVPALLMVDMARRQLWLEDVCSPYGLSLGQWFHKVLDLNSPALYLKKMADDLGRLLAKMHANNIIHGDLTTANILVKLETKDTLENYRLYLIDFGLSSINHRMAANFRDEDIAVDLYVFERALISALAICRSDGHFEFTPEKFFNEVLLAYKEAYPEEALKQTLEKPNIVGSTEIPKRKGKECKSATLARTLEDARHEAKGILDVLKEVKSRGRKRTMIG